MYLYFNNEGELTTNIPHGEILRQGSSLNIVVCLNLDFFYSKEENQADWKVNVQLGLPNNKIGTTKIVSDFSISTFHKTNDSEATYDLIDGREYYMYKFTFTPAQATTIAGKLEIYTSLIKMIAILDQYGVSTGEYSEEDIIYNGTASVYIERVFGYDQKLHVDESNLHYQNLVTQINEIDTRKENRKFYSLDTTTVAINYTLSDKNVAIFTASNINSVAILLPSSVGIGFESAVNIKTGIYSIAPNLVFGEGTLFIKNGEKIDISNYEIAANSNVCFKVINNGLGIYCYIEEIER